MSLRQEHQMNLDTESATQTGMECQSMSSHKYLLLQAWCGLLTVAMVVMAACLSSIKLKTTEDEVSTLKPDVSPKAPLQSVGLPLSYIQLTKPSDNSSWQDSTRSNSSFLVRRENSIHCTKESLYFIYALVTFSKYPKRIQGKSVILIRNAQFGKGVMKLVDGIYPHTTEGSVWVANIAHLKEGDTVSINIKGDFQTDNTFWGAYQLH